MKSAVAEHGGRGNWKGVADKAAPPGAPRQYSVLYRQSLRECPHWLFPRSLQNSEAQAILNWRLPRSRLPQTGMAAAAALQSIFLKLNRSDASPTLISLQTGSI